MMAKKEAPTANHVVLEKMTPPDPKPRGGGGGGPKHPIYEQLDSITHALMSDPGEWYLIGKGDTAHSTYYNALVNDTATTDPDTGKTVVFYEVRAVPVGTTGEFLTDKEGNVKLDAKTGEPRERRIYDVYAMYVGDQGRQKRRQKLSEENGSNGS